MADPNFKADVTFERVGETQKWVTYKVSDRARGHIGVFRINKQNGFADDRDEEGVLQLGAWFGGLETPAQFVERFELLNWVYQAMEQFVESGEYPNYEVIST